MPVQNPTHLRLLERYMTYSHLPPDLQAISQPVCELAWKMAELLQESADPAEVTIGLRKLLEAKDALVRARLP